MMTTGKAHNSLPGYTTAGKLLLLDSRCILLNASPVKDYVVVNDRWGHGDLCKNGGYFTCRDHYNPGVTIQVILVENEINIYLFMYVRMFHINACI